MRGLVDGFNRTATDLRVSLTDKCNLRCQYCMPAEGLPWLTDEQLLTTAEMKRLITIAVELLGVKDVRFTGGEPLVRPDVEQIVAHAHSLKSSEGVHVRTSLTSNGLLLPARVEGLVAAGLDRVNISLDTLHPERFARLSRRDRWHDVVAGLEAAAAVGLRPVKVNSVLMRGVNDDEAGELLAWCLDRGYELRFIEQMPLGPVGTWQRSDFITVDEIRGLLSKDYELVALPDSMRGAAPAEVYAVYPKAGGPQLGTVGLIASVSEPFCGACNRVRLTADGQVRNCLFSELETDLRGALRDGASDAQLAELWRGEMRRKKAGHGIDDESFLQPSRPMSAIGG